MPRLPVTIVLLAAFPFGGCSTGDPIAHWAMDPITLHPSGEAVTGFQTWQLYEKPWKRSFDDKHYLCSVVVQIEGPAIPADCTACTVAFAVTPEIVDTDCSSGNAADATFLSLERVALADGAGEDAPYPGWTSISMADYGAGWEEHGWAWPEGLEDGAEPNSATWDGVESFALWPVFAWELEGATQDLTPVSRIPGPQ